MTISFGSALLVGAAVACCGAVAAGWRRDRSAVMVAVPLLAAGAAICLAGVSRFAAGREDAVTGQELAALVSVTGLAAAILGAAWGRGGVR